jgi:hypothetical protein
MLPFAHTIEIWQVVVAFVAFCLLIWATADRWIISSDIKASGENGDKQAHANDRLRSEVSRLLVVTALLVGGILSVLWPPPSTFDAKDPRFVPLIEMANAIDPNIIIESQLEHSSVVSSRIVAIVSTVILVFDSWMARRTTRRFTSKRGADKKGQAGAQGVAGEQGKQGERGPAGIAGPAGVAGVTGPSGATGAAGAVGASGSSSNDTQDKINVIERDVREIKKHQIDIIEENVKEIRDDVKTIIE